MKHRNSLRARLTVGFTTLLIAVGLLGGGGAYITAQHDPENFLDGQMREIALDTVGAVDDLAEVPAPPHDEEDMIAIQAWDADGNLLKSLPPGIDIPRQTETGFSDLSTATDRWRSYTWVMDDGAVQVSQRAALRRELALKAALPVAIVLASATIFVGAVSQARGYCGPQKGRAMVRAASGAPVVVARTCASPSLGCSLTGA